jgi:hypothetical protein
MYKSKACENSALMLMFTKTNSSCAAKSITDFLFFRTRSNLNPLTHKLYRAITQSS